VPAVPAATASTAASAPPPTGAEPARRAAAVDGGRTRPGYFVDEDLAPGAPLGAGDAARWIGRTMPLGFSLDEREREVLNVLGRQPRLTAGEVAILAATRDPVAWMEALTDKLADHGLDLVAPGPPAGAEPTWVLRR
jgi:hypothetical protein